MSPSSRVRSLLASASLLALAMLLPTGCAATSTGGTAADPVVTYANADAAGLKVRWQRHVPLARSRGERAVKMWRVNDAIYVATNQGQLHSINATAGTTNWSADLGDTNLNLRRPAEAAGGKQLVVINSSTAWVIDKPKGEVIKTGGFPFGAASDPVIIGNLMLVGAGADFFHAVYIDFLGRPKWNLRSAHDAFDSTPVITAGKNVVLASRKGFIWSVKADDGDALWERKTGGGEVEAPLATDGQRIYVAALNNKLYAFDALTGNHLWDARVEGKLDQAPMPAGLSILTVGSGQGLVAVTADKGDRKWYVPGVKQVISHSATQVFAQDAAGQLLVINLETGKVEATVPVSNPGLYAHNDATPTVFALTRDGRLTALEPVAK